MARGDHTLKRFDGSWVMWLESDLVSRDTADSWAGVTQHALDERSQNIDGQWARLAFLTPYSMNGMSADERRWISERALQSLTATRIAQVVHQSNARGSHLGPRMGSTGDEHCNGIRAGAKQLVACLLTNRPVVGVEILEVAILDGFHGCRSPCRLGVATGVYGG